MPLNKNHLKSAKLYLILDAQVLDHSKLLQVLKESVRFGVGIVQLRDKFGTAKDILTFSRHALAITRHQIPFILNDRLDLTILSKADGVHVGQDDVGYAEARRFLGRKAIIGVSCQSLAQAKRAQDVGADYIGFGSVFKTNTKPERNPMDLKLLRRVLNTVEVPVFPIGGISRQNIKTLTDLGATRAAVCRDLLLADNVGHVVKEFKFCLGE
jgi:thiamine-phosphate pyrophosphorylase